MFWSLLQGLSLEEEMVKLDMHIFSQQQTGERLSMISGNKRASGKIRKYSKQYQKDTGVYIRPTALLQKQPEKTKEGKDEFTVLMSKNI